VCVCTSSQCNMRNAFTCDAGTAKAKKLHYRLTVTSSDGVDEHYRLCRPLEVVRLFAAIGSGAHDAPAAHQWCKRCCAR